jgi:hypothetical protein
MTGLEIGLLAGLILCTGLYGFLLREFRKVHKQQVDQATRLEEWQGTLMDLSDSLREDERVRMASALLEEKAGD